VGQTSLALGVGVVLVMLAFVVARAIRDKASGNKEFT
jgi:hypothetical protein